MMKTKYVWLALGLLVLLGCGLLVAALLDDGMTPPKLPTKSQRNTLALTSNGCCFFVEDVDVSLLGGDGETLPIAHHDKVYEHDIHRHKIPDFAEGPVQLVVSFRAFYGDAADFALPVLEVDSIGVLKSTGVLLYFQESDGMYLNVIAGGHHASYKMGGEENRWTLMDTPNKVYDR